jgi:hypothetical protein
MRLTNLLCKDVETSSSAKEKHTRLMLRPCNHFAQVAVIGFVMKEHAFAMLV